ncbi:ABC transporter substrate-binding protein [Yersinia ruckeri]|uniref:phosphoglycerate transport regulatory protein PgtC n=1 Tax=Yersinia ruckeri TaxID=29486 RepID=A0A085U589_YERRU|nr:extracellular solute-binding protein [Yersinia ruckeri]EEP99825.1 Phosphoglycerate transport regulatory protein pgtC [Yersinia ruckeri ATCC 29473]KFE38352.1 ABC transporter substrate-binding protein [Yersinia ruckeri]KGA49636.1 phosphoglycerate transport regulatory protein pgtC [Yersinia ruckeri ATCC 29473]QTD75791.1 Phosphoglycerate transport regulatory protein PgtC [Yersinia ruckeri]
MMTLRNILLSVILYTGFPPLALSNELVIATTFSPEATAHIITEWHKQPQAVPIRTLNRTSSSLERLLSTPMGDNIDLVLTSSPMLMQHLQDHQRLAMLPPLTMHSQQRVPESLRSSTAAVAISGYGILANSARLKEKHLPTPVTWDGLKDARYQGMILMSSPSRSDTNHLMIETLLQQRGWQQGWETLLEISGNLATISSRSFGVSNKIKTGLGIAGPIIDNYATLLLKDPQLTFSYFPESGASPTFIAMTNNRSHQTDAARFINFLLSDNGQKAVSDTDTGKYPVTPLPVTDPRAKQQQRLLQQTPLDYRQILQRQRLVQQLFDTAITFRLHQLQDAWKALHSAEARLKRPLPEIRALLTAVPVSPQQAVDADYLQRFNQPADNTTESELMLWQQFFQKQQHLAIQQLESLK